MAAESAVRIIFLGDSAQAVRSVSRLEASFASLGTAAKLGAAAIGIAMVGAMAAATKAAVDFDRSMRNVNSIAKLSEKQFQDLSTRVLALAGPTGQAPKVLADGLYDIVSSGFKANAAIKILAVSAKAATAGMTDTATASKAVVAVLNAYHMSADKAKNVSSLLFTEVNKGVNTFEELATNIGDTAPLAASLKIPFSDVSAGLALITLHGTSMAEAATQMSRVMADLLKPSTALKAELHSLGYENGQAAIAAHGFIPLITQLSEAAKGSSATTADWFQNIRSLRGMLNLTGPNLAKFNQFADEMAQSFKKGGADVSAFNEQAKSISVQWAMAKDALIAAAIPLGQLLFPALAKTAGAVASLAEAITRYMPQIQLVVGTVARAIGQAWNTYAIPVLKSFEGEVQKMAGLVRQNWGYISAQAQATSRSVSSALHSTGQAIQDLRPLIRALGPEFKVAFGLALLAVRNFTQTIATAMKIIAAVIHAVAPVVAALVNGVNRGFGEMAQAARGVASAIVQAVHVIVGVLRTVAGAVKGAFNIGPIGAMINAVESLIGVVQTLIGWISKIHFPHAPSGGPASSGGTAPGQPRGPKGGRAHGGFIPGPSGAPVQILAHAGEVILNRAQQEAIGGPGAIARMFGFRGDEGPGFAAGGIVNTHAHHHHHPVRSRYKTAARRARGGLKVVDHINQEEDDLDRTYGQLERQYQIDGTLDVTEIDALITERNKMLLLLEEEKKALVKAIKELQKAIKVMAAQLKKERANKKPNTTRISNLSSLVSDFQRSIGDANLNLKHQLPFDVRDVQLDIADLQQQKLTTSAAAGPDVAALIAEIARLTRAFNIQGAQQAVIGSFAKGTLSVPQTGLALVHAGEQITPAGRARGDRSESAPSQPHIEIHFEKGLEWLEGHTKVIVDGRITELGRDANARARSGRH